MGVPGGLGAAGAAAATMPADALAEELIDYLNASWTAFHAVAESKKLLVAEGYVELAERDAWTLSPGGKYFFTRNMSTLVAFAVGGKAAPVRPPPTLESPRHIGPHRRSGRAPASPSSGPTPTRRARSSSPSPSSPRAATCSCPSPDTAAGCGTRGTTGTCLSAAASSSCDPSS